MGRNKLLAQTTYGLVFYWRVSKFMHKHIKGLTLIEKNVVKKRVDTYSVVCSVIMQCLSISHILLGCGHPAQLSMQNNIGEKR